MKVGPSLERAPWHTIEDIPHDHVQTSAQVTAWLKCKTQRVVACLAASGGAFAGMDRPALEGYVIGLLGEYMSPGMAATLRAALGHGAQGGILSNSVPQRGTTATHKQD